MKIKQLIKDSIVNSPFMFGYFLRSMAAVLVADSHTRLQHEVPTIEFGGQKQSGRAVKNPKTEDIAKVLSGLDLLRGGMQNTQLVGFLEWFLKEEGRVADDGMNVWNDVDFLTEKWNEFANKDDGEEDEDE